MVSTEAELLAALEGEGRATVAAGVTIDLTKPLAVCDDPSNVFEAEKKHSEDSLCVHSRCARLRWCDGVLSVAVVQRDSVSIVAAAGAQPTVRGPGGAIAVGVYGAARLELQGLAVECPSGGGWAVYCDKKGRAELSGCTLTSPVGLFVFDGATATMDGGAISGCKTGVYCHGSGSTVTVRPPVRVFRPLARVWLSM